MFIALSRKHNMQTEDRFTHPNRLVITGCLWLSVSCSEQALCMCSSHNVLSILMFVYKIPDYFTELKSVYHKPLHG